MKDSIKHFGFNPENYKLLFIGLAVNILGYILMIGGGAENPGEFNADELFSTTRITVAPILIVLGYGIILYSVMKKSKNSAVKISAISEEPKTEDNKNQINKVKKDQANKDMLYGALWCIGGIVMTVSDFGFYFWGAILFGGYQFLKGAMNS